jgi:hypothetical protein
MFVNTTDRVAEFVQRICSIFPELPAIMREAQKRKSDFSACIRGMDDEALYARALNLLSHGKVRDVRTITPLMIAE